MAKNKIPLGTTCEYIIYFILSFSIYDKADEEKNKTEQQHMENCCARSDETQAIAASSHSSSMCRSETSSDGVGIIGFAASYV
jgi:hypothetical protein